jgi:hypothetical protein
MPVDPDKLRRTLSHVVRLLTDGEYDALESLTALEACARRISGERLRSTPCRWGGAR